MRPPRMSALLVACSLVIVLPGRFAFGATTPEGITYPCAIKLVGKNGLTSSNHTIEVGAPVGSEVCIEFSACNQARDPGPAEVQNAFIPVSVNCQQKRICATVGPGAGVAIIDAQGMASAGAIGTTPSGPCARILVDETLVATVQVSAFDLNGGIGGPGMTAADLSIWLDYFFACSTPPNYCAIADYDFADGGCVSQQVSAADLAMWLTEFFSAASNNNDGICPP